MKKLNLLLLVVTACKSSQASKSSVDAVPCDPAGTELAKRLETANGFSMDLTDPKTKPAIEAAKQGLEGKKYAFKNCAFAGQGNDTVSFAATAGAEHEIKCVMAGGEAGNKKFRQAAMDFDLSKLELDVTGTIAMHEGRLALTGCSITPHD